MNVIHQNRKLNSEGKKKKQQKETSGNGEVKTDILKRKKKASSLA